MPPAPIPDVPSLPRDDGGPVFKEPWEAQAFALAVRLSEAGWFSWQQWTRALALEIQAANQQGGPDPGYYTLWLRALERLCVARGLVSGPEVERRKDEWRQAYLHTPHGQPVELSAGRRAGT